MKIKYFWRKFRFIGPNLHLPSLRIKHFIPDLLRIHFKLAKSGLLLFPYILFNTGSRKIVLEFRKGFSFLGQVVAVLAYENGDPVLGPETENVLESTI